MHVLHRWFMRDLTLPYYFTLSNVTGNRIISKGGFLVFPKIERLKLKAPCIQDSIL